MNQGAIMVCVIVIFVALVAYDNWRREHPQAPTDLSQIPRYFQRSLSTLNTNRWIVLVPFCYFAASFLLDLPKYLKFHHDWLARFQNPPVGILAPSTDLSELPKIIQAAVGPSI